MRRKYVIAPQMLPNKKIIEEMDKSWKTEDGRRLPTDRLGRQKTGEGCSGFFFVVNLMDNII